MIALVLERPRPFLPALAIGVGTIGGDHVEETTAAAQRLDDLLVPIDYLGLGWKRPRRELVTELERNVSPSTGE